MKKFLSILALAAVLGFSVPLQAQQSTYSNIDTYTNLQPDENALAKASKSEMIFTRIGYVIGVGLIVWFFVARAMKKKKKQ